MQSKVFKNDEKEHKCLSYYANFNCMYRLKTYQIFVGGVLFQYSTVKRLKDTGSFDFSTHIAQSIYFAKIKQSFIAKNYG